MRYVILKPTIAIYFGFFGLKQYNNNPKSTNKRKKKAKREGCFIFSVITSYP